MEVLKKMSKDLRIDENIIINIAENNKSYKKFYIRKKGKKKKTRAIYQPSRELKVLQYWIVENLVKQLPVSIYSQAYENENSIKKNAMIHRNSNHLLHIDIENFFESINDNHIEILLRKISGIQEKEIELIKKIVLYDNKFLVVGSVASPSIANRIMYDIDMEIFEKCIKGSELKFTRYADDIYISSKSFIKDDIVGEIDNILREHDLHLNTKKTHFMSKKKRRKVTGIVIDNNNNSLSLGCKKYKQIRKMIYNYLVKENSEENEKMYQTIRGYLALIKDLNMEKYISIRESYEKYDKKSLLF
ncbi:retron St85 family RNA-directed DNA polymerase [Clostridium butyricum]|uniref:retron St85 family RNA-directed DNA polymerase n=1 Tax=Clostridium butyricum TaxID=1492 RepID=UPI0034666BDD